MSISVGLFVLLLAAAFILGLLTMPLLLYFFLTSPAKIYNLARARQEA